jgi:hypothetical protein
LNHFSRLYITNIHLLHFIGQLSASHIISLTDDEEEEGDETPLARWSRARNAPRVPTPLRTPMPPQEATPPRVPTLPWAVTPPRAATSVQIATPSTGRTGSAIPVGVQAGMEQASRSQVAGTRAMGSGS